jgi:predicted AAA+ superfamily ATPase
VKTVSEQQLAEHLRRLNPWWTDTEASWPADELKPRAYVPRVLQLLTDTRLRRAVVLLGPRRVGKTILIHHVIGGLLRGGVAPGAIGHVEMDHPLLHGQTVDDLVRQFERLAPAVEGPRYLFFDEIQAHRDWERYLKPLVDHRPDLRVLVSGSAAAALKRRSDESGAGRFTDFLLPPLTFSEYLSLRSEQAAIEQTVPGRYRIHDIDLLNRQFVDYVNFGGYPELALSPAVRSDPHRFVKSDIVDKVLLRDLPQLYGIQDIQELNALFTLLALNTAEEVSFEQISKRSGIAKPTIQRYIEYLEAAFLLARVFRVDQDGRRYQRERQFKVFLTNPAMYTGLFGPRSADATDFGHLVETAIFAQRLHGGGRLHYARWGADDCEVDLVESSPTMRPTTAVEIKWSDRHVEHPEGLKGLLRFSRHNRLSKAMATTRSRLARADIGDCQIQLWPAAALAYHYGVRAVHDRLASTDLEIEFQT